MARSRVCFFACAVLISTASGEAGADVTPTTLRMRKVEPASARTSRVRKLVLAQAPTPTPTEPTDPAGDPTAPPASSSDAAGDPTAPPASSSDPTAPPPAPITDEPAPPANVSATPDLSDEELAKLAEAQADGQGEVIVVTGSTIERREFTTPAPVTVLNKADLAAAGQPTVGDIVQRLPAQSNAINAQVNNGGDGSTRISLRGLGAARTLVLLNGRRVVPGGTGADASVDLNAIPLAVIERVEVLKDGASAVYGSDAIGGVVNIITRDDFNGTEAVLYSGTAQPGDGITYDMSFVTGHSSKRGNVIFSAGWQRREPIFAGDRTFSAVDRTYDFETREESMGGSTATPNGRISTSTIDVDGDGMPDGNDLCGQPICQPDGNGGWRPFTAPDDLYNYQPANYLYTPSERYNVFGAGHYKLTDNSRVFFEGLYLNRRSDQQLAPEPFIAATPISAQSIYNTAGGDVYDYRRRLEEFGPRQALQNVDTFRLVTGVGGKVSEDAAAFKNWKWELSFNYGRTTALQRNAGNLILSRLANALGPSFVDANGTPRCGTAATGPIPGCVPMNIMGPSGSISQEMIDYVTFTGVSTGNNEQRTALAQASGRLVKLPNGGDISLALGADYRREAGGYTPDPLTATGDTTGNAQAPTDGSYNVAEAFGELSVVPISGTGAAQWFEVNVAARGFRYNTFGRGATWKAGTLLKTYGGFGLRGTYSTAFRAPSVAELYQGKADSFPLATDPCDTTDGPITNEVTRRRCAEQGVPADAMFGAAQQRSIVGGNPGLAAETAKVFTAGMVFEPPAVEGLGVTLDYFNIKIRKAIQALGAQVILTNCYVRDQDDACAQVVRDPQLNYAIDYIDDPISNVGGTATDGIDFAVVLDAKHGGAGRFRNQFEAQYLRSVTLDNTLQILQGVGYYDLGVFPKLKANLSTLWSRQRLSAGLLVRYVGGFKECVDNDCNTPENLEMASRDVPSYLTGDLYAGFTFKEAHGTTQLTVGVNNVANARPPLIYVGFAGDSDASTYDYMGRYFYARLSHLF